MTSVKQKYRDISPVTLQVVGGAVSSSLYCEQVEGVEGVGEGAGGLVEAFLVELYRCKLCQFTCGLKNFISSHLLLRHRPPTLTYVGASEEHDGAEDDTEARLQQGASQFQLDLNEESKQNEDEEFLLYSMLDNMSPPTCDISTEGGLQVAHTCEVSTLFEEEEAAKEEESIFPLKGSSLRLSCSIDPPATQEEMAQSAHLMTLGLCRISTARPPPPPPEDPSHLSQADSFMQSRKEGQQTKTPSSSRGLLPCFQCSVMLPSRQLLDVHVRSHRAAGGFSCVGCSWKAESWEELETHWRSRCRRKGRRRRREEDRKKRKVTRVCLASQRTISNTASQTQTKAQHSSITDGRRRPLSGCVGELEAEHANRRAPCSQSDVLLSVTLPSQTTGPQSVSLNITDKKNRTKSMKKKTKAEETEQRQFCCSLCHRNFSSKLTLRRHLGVHRGEKPFTCPHCSYSSRLKASLLQHLRTHTGEKPYRCAECPYASIDRSSLLRHCRTHSQEKPYRCQHCDYSSIQKKSLDLHSRRHHTGEAFPCGQCEYSSPDRQLLLRHVRQRHASSLHTTL